MYLMKYKFVLCIVKRHIYTKEGATRCCFVINTQFLLNYILPLSHIEDVIRQHYVNITFTLGHGNMY